MQRKAREGWRKIAYRREIVKKCTGKGIGCDSGTRKGKLCWRKEQQKKERPKVREGDGYDKSEVVKKYGIGNRM